MSQYYNPKKTRNLYTPNSQFPFRVSRSKVDLFLNCPRCFYLDVKLGVGQPPGYPFTLNSAVDKLLKREFDIHRAKGTPHPLMKSYGLDAVPLLHEKMNQWRDALGGGITFVHKETNFYLTGGVDDVWVNPQGEFIIVDYKATAKDGEVNIDAEWQISYKRQMEFYQWLFRKNSYPVSEIGYFVYCNGHTDREAFDAKLEFGIKLIPYKGDDSWVEPTIFDIHHCLNKPAIPLPGPDCDFCKYRQAVRDVER
ncbi:MAG: PD-(D/E)XK nuclease family protein [Candidatus Pacebacteria bacterium]|nr:PD-(D/E)XK nuclease family protein [Candidatus Paceibacterota bacterium]